MSRAENTVLQQYRKYVIVKGFRPGHAPLEMVRADIGSERLLDEVIRTLLPQTLSNILSTHQLNPIIPPKIAVTIISPLTITLTLVEHPTINVKKIPTIEKKEVNVRDEDLQRVIDTALKQYQQPELTDTFVREKLGGTSVASFKEEVRKNLISYEERCETQRREHALLDSIRDAVQVDLAPELLTEEQQILTQEFLEDIKRANVSLDDWCKQMKKTPEELSKEIKTQAEHRLKIRFGIEYLIENRNIVADDQSIQNAALTILQRLSEKDRAEQQSLYQKGKEGYERLKWKIRVGELMNQLLK